jgi:hypothetical protein
MARRSLICSTLAHQAERLKAADIWGGTSSRGWSGLSPDFTDSQGRRTTLQCDQRVKLLARISHGS